MGGRQVDIDMALIRSVANMMNDSFLVLDHDLNLLFANDRFYYHFGIRPEKGARNLFEIAGGKLDLPGLREFLEQTKAQTSDCTNLDLESEVPGMGRSMLSFTARCIAFTGGRCSLLLVSIHDMTEWLRSLRDLAESEKRFAHFVEGIPLGVFIVDARGDPCFENRVFAMLTGKGKEDIKAALQESSLTGAIGAYRASTDEPYPPERDPLTRALGGMGTCVTDMELRRDGRSIFLEVTGAPIYDDQGEIAYAVAIYKDITISRSQGAAHVKKVAKGAPG
jgi:PAS domain-containing protein